MEIINNKFKIKILTFFQRNDIAMAITKFDQFDFLIDIVPRDDIKPNKPREDGTRTAVNSDQVYYCFLVSPALHLRYCEAAVFGLHIIFHMFGVYLMLIITIPIFL